MILVTLLLFSSSSTRTFLSFFIMSAFADGDQHTTERVTVNPELFEASPAESATWKSKNIVLKKNGRERRRSQG